MAQSRIEFIMTLRRGESLLVTIGIPAGLLLLFSLIPITSTSKHPVDLLLAGTLAIAVMASAMVSLGISTGYERHYLVLKRLGGTPLGRARLIAAKIITILAIEVLQTILLIGLAIFVLHAHNNISWAALGATILLGTAAFAGIGSSMAGRLRAEANLTAANALFLLLLVFGGSVVPLSRLPHALAAVARALPAAPLTEMMKWAVRGGAIPFHSLIVLSAWAVITLVLAIKTFSWE
ncbi:MAG: ABC transporter permease [Actinomycetota bacterium]|nr:ABC transporter permease [Actinomycetota bacterium]